MPKPSWDVIRGKVREVVAKDKGYDPLEIHDQDNLKVDLRYDDGGLAGLAAPINNKFFGKGKPGLAPGDIQACLKVVGIAIKVDEQPGANFK
jgi:hypothetical protein